MRKKTIKGSKEVTEFSRRVILPEVKYFEGATGSYMVYRIRKSAKSKTFTYAVFKSVIANAAAFDVDPSLEETHGANMSKLWGHLWFETSKNIQVKEYKKVKALKIKKEKRKLAKTK